MIKELDLTDEASIIGIESLMDTHFAEVSKSVFKLKINWNFYKTMQAHNRLVLFGAFERDVLVGYAALLLIEPPHYMGELIALSDTIFVLKEFRNSSHGLKLIKITEDKAKELGASEVHWYSKPESNLDLLFDKKGYMIRDVVRTRRL